MSAYREYEQRNMTNAHHQDEQQLIMAAKAGCIDAFTTLVDRYQSHVLRYFVRQTSDMELAADLTQETFLDAFRRLDRLHNDCPFLAWVYRIGHYNLLHEWRRQRIRRTSSLDWLIEQCGDANRALHQADKTQSTHERHLIQQTLDALSPTLREPLLLNSLGGFTSQEIAHMLGIGSAAVRQRIARAKEQFRHQYYNAHQDAQLAAVSAA